MSTNGENIVGGLNWGEWKINKMKGEIGLSLWGEHALELASRDGIV